MRYLDFLERVVLLALGASLTVASMSSPGTWLTLVAVSGVTMAIGLRGFILGKNLQTFANHGYWLCGKSLYDSRQEASEGFWTELFLAPWLAYAVVFLLHIPFIPEVWPFWVLGALMSVMPIGNSIIAYVFYTRTVAAAQEEIDQESK